MRTMLATLCALLVLGGCEQRGDRETGAALDRADNDTLTTTAAAEGATDAALDWQPGPPALPAGVRLAVLEGDPAKAGPFRIRLDMPDGYEVRPHYHPMSEQLEVIEGTVLLGRGKKWDEANLKPLAVGDETDMAAKEPHFVRARERTVLEVRSTGPFEITYINAADDPRKASTQ